MTQPQIILTGFADEGVSKQPEKSIKEQFTAYAAIGLQYYSIRFIDVGNGTKNVMNLTMDEIQTIREGRFKQPELKKLETASAEALVPSKPDTPMGDDLPF